MLPGTLAAMPRLTVCRTHPDDPRLEPLVHELDRLLRSIDSDELHEKVSPYNKLEPEMNVVLALVDGEAVGCGALRSRDSQTGEVKRMFVSPSARGQGAGAAIVAELEAIALELGHRRLVLETIADLESANRLYARSGFVRIPNYPPYEDIVESVCYGKSLVTS